MGPERVDDGPFVIAVGGLEAFGIMLLLMFLCSSCSVDKLGLKVFGDPAPGCLVPEGLAEVNLPNGDEAAGPDVVGVLKRTTSKAPKCQIKYYVLLCIVICIQSEKML